MKKYQKPGETEERRMGVAEYDIGDDYIKVRFVNQTAVYKYSYAKSGRENVEEMKQLAQAGEGLTKFLGRNSKRMGFDTE